MRYFLEVSYNGTNYGGSQIQKNSNTIQQELEKVLGIVYKTSISLTGSSRTDAGVHAYQNFFHFDFEGKIENSSIYNLNALLPKDIAVKSLNPVPPDAHCRFLASARQYKYFLTSTKDPFSINTAWYYPFQVEIELLQAAANILLQHTCYKSFAKRNSQVHSYECIISESKWIMENNSLVYIVKANRFLRGMVRGLVGTMLLVGRKKISVEQFEEIILSKDCTKANFATPAHGLFLLKVEYPTFK